MTKILFVCHGNICRSPTAEFLMKHMVSLAGLEGEFEIASAATSYEEYGNPVYPPSRRMLAEHGIDCSGKTAQVTRFEDYEYYDLLIGMDEANLRNMRRIYGGDPEGKLHALMEYAGKPGVSVADPWYTRNFQQTWEDVSEGCEGLLYELTGSIILDFSACDDRRDFYRVMREKMDWQEWYGSNLDALSDILTGLPHKGSRFALIMPREENVRGYAEKIAAIFTEAGKTVLIR